MVDEKKELSMRGNLSDIRSMFTRMEGTFIVVRYCRTVLVPKNKDISNYCEISKTYVYSLHDIFIFILYIYTRFK